MLQLSNLTRARPLKKNDVDGPLLSALTHRHFGAVMLESMGFSLSEQEVLISGIKNYHHV